MQYFEPTVAAIPFFLVSLLGEAWLLRRWRRAGRQDVLGYDLKDAAASITLGIGSLIFVSGINLGIFALAGWYFSHRLVPDLGSGGLAWLVALLGWDFLYYWHHRYEHEIRVLWACHENHHSSQHFNLSTALRQPWTPVAAILFYPLLSLFGVRPELVMVSAGINLIYQFWVHTEAIGKLPRWFEAIFNTPSHHRVHHGSNMQYLDRNYAGILIIWDRLFGTFIEEGERVVYGLTKNIRSFNPVYIAFHEYGKMIRDVLRARSLLEGLGYVLGPPGWKPRD